MSDGKFILSIDNRVPVTFKCEDAQKLVEEGLTGTRFRFENPQITESIYVPKDSFLVETLMEVYKDVTKDVDAVPQVDGACSYARALDNCVAFGALLPGQPDLMHQKNEYLELDRLDTCDLQAGKIVKAGNRVGESAGAGALFHFRGLEGKVGKNYLGKKKKVLAYLKSICYNKQVRNRETS